MKIKKPTLPKVKMNMVVGKRQIVLLLGVPDELGDGLCLLVP